MLPIDLFGKVAKVPTRNRVDPASSATLEKQSEPTRA
jgi:hypothetical protein